MASRRFSPLTTLGVDRIALYGRFFPNGILDPVPSNNKGKGWSVTNVGLGLFIINLEDKYTSLEFATASPQAPATEDYTCSFGQYDGFTIWLQVLQANAAVDIPANANASVSFMLVFKNTEQRMF